MAKATHIEWTEMTRNPAIPTLSGHAMGNDRYRNGFNVTLHEDLVELPLHWRQPRLVFVNSMSDMFHEKIPIEFIHKAQLTMHSTSIENTDPNYPKALHQYLGQEAPEQITAFGNIDLLTQPSLALFCSRKCPGSLILQTSDLAKDLRDAGVLVIGGFHTPVERECLTLLLRGGQPVIVCPSRNMPKRIPAEWKKPLEEGRLLALTPFTEKERRMTAQLAAERNRFVAALAEKIFIAYAAPGGKTEEFCRHVISWGKTLYALDDAANSRLFSLGALRLDPSKVESLRQ